MFGSFFFALAGLVFFGVVSHALNWGFTLTDRGLKRYAVIFAVIVLVIAALQGFTAQALLESVGGWFGYMVGLLLLRWAKVGQLTDRK